MKNKKKKLNQHISTKLGAIVLIIIALTVGVFVWKIGKEQEAPKQQQLTYDIKKPIKTQLSHLNQSNNKSVKSDNIKTTIYTNSTYGFEFEYPQNLVLTQNSTDSIFGLSDQPDGHWTINIEHGIGVEKIEFMHKLFSASDLDVMARVRNAFNPTLRLSPAKMLPTAGACGLEQRHPGRRRRVSPNAAPDQKRFIDRENERGRRRR